MKANLNKMYDNQGSGISMYACAGNNLPGGYKFNEFPGYASESRTAEYSHPGIERIVISGVNNILKNEEAPAVATYLPSNYAGLYTNHKQHNNPKIFLVGESTAPIISSETKIMPFIEEAFEKQTGMPFPHDKIAIHILDDNKFKQEHLKREGTWSNGIQGFALNKQGSGISEIFVRKNHLDSMMLTIGHEIGHCMSPTLPDSRDEEAKAFAFSLAWMQTIKKHNIAGIAHNINPNPAPNGLHDTAYNFVLELMHDKKALQVFNDLAQGITSITKKLETITMEA